MNPYILPLGDARSSLETTGGKGYALSRMVQAGLPVPGGFQVSTEAYRCFVAENHLQSRILEALQRLDPADPQALEETAQSIRRVFLDGEIPAEIAQAISSACLDFHNAPVAVRSSATAEDLPEASFAGQQETYLNIRGAADILEAVRSCWASLWTGRAIAYRVQNQVDQNTVALAVVVQELVLADAAGILFSANPLNGRRDEMVINAAWGLGEAIVSGAVTPDTLTLNKTRLRVIHRETAEKQVMTVRTEAGTQEIPVPEPQKKKAVLNREQAVELARLGIRIEQFFGRPVDVEWALAGGRLAILQARPITALPLEWKIPFPGAMYARGSLAEHIPNPVKPLFASLGLEIANRETDAMWERMLGPEGSVLRVGDGFYQPINGYVYGGVRMTAKEMGSAMKMSFKNLGILRSSRENLLSARQELAGVVEDWRQKPLDSLSPSELLDGLRAVIGAACQYFTRIQLILPAASMSEMLFTSFYNALIRRRKDPLASIFLLGAETIALRAEKSLFDLSRWVKASPALEKLLLETSNEDLLAALRGEAVLSGLPGDLWQEWRARFQQHLQAYAQTAYEFDFSNPTPFDEPGPLLEALKAYLQDQARSPYERQREALAKREAAERAILKRLIWPFKGWFQRMLTWAQSTSPLREDSIFDLGMGHPLIRGMLSELGRRFAEKGAIAEPEDIYWLEKREVEELAAGLESGAALPQLSERIPARKAQWQAYRKASPPLMLPERSGWMVLMHGGEARRKEGKIVLKGIGTSAGRVTAPACVLLGPQDFPKMRPGDVLVAVTTTPAWTPLFGLASAVVTDIGGPLSHSSIVAREYGIPAVMAARTATRSIQNGQILSVDGAAGTVTLV